MDQLPSYRYVRRAECALLMYELQTSFEIDEGWLLSKDSLPKLLRGKNFRAFRRSFDERELSATDLRRSEFAKQRGCARFCDTRVSLFLFHVKQRSRDCAGST